MLPSMMKYVAPSRPGPARVPVLPEDASAVEKVFWRAGKRASYVRSVMGRLGIDPGTRERRSDSGTHNDVTFYPRVTVRVGKNPVLAMFSKNDVEGLRRVLPRDIMWSPPNVDGAACLCLAKAQDLGELSDLLPRIVSLKAKGFPRADQFVGDLNRELLQVMDTITIWTLCSEHGISPEVFDISLVPADLPTESGSVSGVDFQYSKLKMMIVTQRFQMNLTAFYEIGPGRIFKVLAELAPTEVRMAQQITELVRKLVFDLSIGCTDLKPLNTVLNLGVGLQGAGESDSQFGLRTLDLPMIDVRFIDNDADFCKLNKVLLETDPGRASSMLGVAGWNQETVKQCNYWLGLILLANHCFVDEGRNPLYMAFRASSRELVGDISVDARPNVAYSHMIGLLSDESETAPLFRKLFLYYCRMDMLEDGGNRLGGVTDQYKHTGDFYFCRRSDNRPWIRAFPVANSPLATPRETDCFCIFSQMFFRCFHLRPGGVAGGGRTKRRRVEKRSRSRVSRKKRKTRRRSKK